MRTSEENTLKTAECDREVAAPGVARAVKERRPRSFPLAGAGSRWRQVMVTTLSVVVGLGLWSMLAWLQPNLVSNLGQLFSAGRHLEASGALEKDILASLFRVVSGFLIGSVTGILVGAALGWYKPLRAIVDPWIQFVRMIPSLALIPLAIVYLGIGEAAKIAVIALAVFLTVVVATIDGVAAASPLLVRAARVLGATDRQLFQTVIIPGAIPYVLVGLRLGVAQGWTTVVAAELIAANSGLGYLVQQSGTYFDLPSLYLAVLLIGVVGLIMNWLITLLERRTLVWQERVRP